MASEESDDEPLSVLAENKKLHPEKYAEQLLPEIELVVVPRKKKKKNLLPKKLIESMTIKLSQNMNQTVTRPVIDRPADVWLYLKDFNPAGPYSCLLCTEWFVNRSKMIIHYVLNHKKDFCGICRYFVPDRQAWLAHLDFHAPWLCSQCVENFETDTILRHHLSSVHKLVHCRLCHFRLPDDDQYHTHLLKKHNVTDVTSKDAEYPWEIEYDGCPKFLCLLCSKPNLNKTFFAHYMGYHHFTLKCFTHIISGRDPPFTVSGADLSSEFVDGQLKNQAKYGYVDIDRKPFDFGQESDQSMHSETNTLMNVLIPAIKQEEFSEPEEPDDPKCEEIEQEDVSQDDHITKTYKGDEDFDVTLMELVMLQKCYSDYVNRTLNDINSNLVPQKSDIDYEKVNMDFSMDVDCALCKTGYNTLQDFTAHMSKMHCAKIVPLFSCRVCATVFDTKQELESHLAQEMGDFEDLWLCQFCDNEYNDREETRRHLTSHWELIEYDNCFSPHLGFKCKYCPTLFWNETDRETHQVRVHFNKHKEDYYKCDSCSEIFSDKIWFIHHYLGKHLDKDANMPLYLLKCCLCCVVLSTMSEIRSHFESNHPEARKVFCSLDACKYKPFSHRKSFKLHLRTIHNPSAQTRIEGSVSCAVCAREFASSRACSAHMAQVHGPGKFKCKLCREVLHTMDERKLHYLIRHPGRHPFECNECGKSFQYKSSLYMHKQEHVPNKQTYTCSVCGKIFMKKDSFREHVQIHEGPRHACSYCPMRFVQRSNMLRHERRHTGERPYACPHCSRTFADKGACTSHARTHSKETSYACVYCGQTFVQKSKLTYHTRKHTGENLETCSVCSKLFTSACSLREHMKVHASKELKTVKCPLCDRHYQDERYMMRHLRSAHTRAHFSCPVCNKTVTSASGLRHHVITHSDLNTFQCKICPKSYSVKRSIIKHLRRRHGLQGTEINIKDFFTRLDPRECNLGLEEDVMTTIFGPPKKRITDVIISDYVTLKKKPKAKPKENVEETEKNEEPEHEETEHSEDDSKANSHNDNQGGHSEIVVIKTERKEESDEELEPTDFVSVKIECVEEVNGLEMQ